MSDINCTLSLEEAAAFLGFKSTNRFRDKVKSGKYPGFKAGRDWRFIKEDLIEFVRRQYTTNLIEEATICQSLKIPKALTIRRDLLLKSSSMVNQSLKECRDLREKLKNQGQNNMKQCSKKK